MNVEFEFSAGGVVKEKNRFLLIKTADKSIWTFPKGKLKKGESSSQAALREVLEETGYRCRIEKEITDVRYLFKRQGRLVIKKVQWFLMSPVQKLKEVPCMWHDYNSCHKLLKYKSDLNLL